MSQGTDQRYLLTHQYRDASNLSARMRLHARFSTNPYGWHRWVFDRLQLPPAARILEPGCGPGTLWRENDARIPEQWEILLTDFSSGMLREARQKLADGPHRFALGRVDAQAIPFAAASFDVVIANHMLYHVPDRAKAFPEIRRVLKPDGRLYAATNGPAHMRELHERVRSIMADRRADATAAGLAEHGEAWVEAFNLENGEGELARWFRHVTLHRYPDELRVTEAEPLVAYVLSGRYGFVLTGERLAAFTVAVEAEIATRGAFQITKETGLFEARP